MANIEHSTLTHTQVHEPRWITTAGTGDTGKVITPSGSTAGISELRYLVESEISTKKGFLQATMADVSNPSDVYIIAPFAGTLNTIYAVLQSGITVANSTVYVYCNGVLCGPSPLSVTYSGSAAGSIYTQTFTTNNTFGAGQLIRINSDGASTTTAILEISLACTRSS